MKIILPILLLSLTGCIRAIPNEAFVDMSNTLEQSTKPELYYLSPRDNTSTIKSKLMMCNADLASQYNDKATARFKIENYK